MTIKYIEIMGDYDGVLFEYDDEIDKYTNRFTWNEFKTYKQYPDYSLTYQFDNEWKLNGYSKYNAEWLTMADDLSKTENNLWGTRWENGKWEMVFVPLKDLSVPHIKNILMNVSSIKTEYKSYFLERLESVINIKTNE